MGNGEWGFLRVAGAAGICVAGRLFCATPCQRFSATPFDRALLLGGEEKQVGRCSGGAHTAA